MKIETKTDIYNTIEVDKVLYHILEDINRPNGRKTNSSDPIPKQAKIPDVIVDSKIFTDGEIIEAIESNSEPINEYRFGNCKYNMPVDTLIKKQVHIKNASYILVVTIAQERVKVGERGWGWTFVIKDSEIFLNNKKDKQALLTAKKTIMAITGSSHPKTVFELILGNPNQSNYGLEYDTVKKNIYQLRKKNSD